ncbi:uncharacterized protein NPIL_154151 [Nephila pilipes]|uniref:Uncharacterized protein n=1 Tax=Nephila pilipes TaxID=299642 RepID=A0A8X6J049_NEPPI|nr:uncharacterized protein NPIL_154151 [Nephila pilipes]
MSYITRMRNTIKFQIEMDEGEYEKLENYPFQHDIVCSFTKRKKLEICLRHALSNVTKSHYLVHNCTPFREWRTINFDNYGFQGGQNRVQRQEVFRVNDDSEPEERFLVAGFQNPLWYSFSFGWSLWNLLRTPFSHTQLNNLQINKSVDYLNLLQNSTWRRVYADNNTYFSFSDAAIAAYVKEQSQRKIPVNVFDEIMKRERGEFFNQFRVLESIALFYYYVLPYQNEGRYNQIIHIINFYLTFLQFSDHCSRHAIFRFKSGLNIARRNTSR